MKPTKCERCRCSKLVLAVAMPNGPGKVLAVICCETCGKVMRTQVSGKLEDVRSWYSDN